LWIKLASQQNTEIETSSSTAISALHS
jgi:hypothetical protein